MSVEPRVAAALVRSDHGLLAARQFSKAEHVVGEQLNGDGSKLSDLGTGKSPVASFVGVEGSPALASLSAGNAQSVAGLHDLSQLARLYLWPPIRRGAGRTREPVPAAAICNRAYPLG